MGLRLEQHSFLVVGKFTDGHIQLPNINQKNGDKNTYFLNEGALQETKLKHLTRSSYLKAPVGRNKHLKTEQASNLKAIIFLSSLTKESFSVCSNKSNNNHILIRDSQALLIVTWYFMNIELILIINYKYKHINEVNEYINACAESPLKTI